VLFGRVLTPDPDRPTRIVLTLNAQRPGGPPAGLCPWVVGRGGAGGGCTPYPFARTILTGTFMANGSNAFLTVSGVASDDVARLDALLADGQRAEVPLVDNVFLVDLPRANLPARLVAYDEEDHVIGVDRPLSDFGGNFRAQPARGRARSLLRVEGYDGATAELFVGPSSDGGECVFTKEFVDRQHAGNGTSCHEPTWNGSALQVGTSWSPPRFVSGRVRSDVKTVRILLADGTAVTLTPTRGHILWAVPREGREPVSIVGLAEDGIVLARQSLQPPEPPTR
jgi:hypothetical protein